MTTLGSFVLLNPQQNGVAERTNRTIMERVMCMLFTSGMEKRFWAKAVATAVKLINKCTSSGINGDTPDLRWYGSYGEYSHLKTFCCKAFAYIKQTKLDARGFEVCHVGVSTRFEGI